MDDLKTQLAEHTLINRQTTKDHYQLAITQVTHLNNDSAGTAESHFTPKQTGVRFVGKCSRCYH